MESKRISVIRVFALLVAGALGLAAACSPPTGPVGYGGTGDLLLKVKTPTGKQIAGVTIEVSGGELGNDTLWVNLTSAGAPDSVWTGDITVPVGSGYTFEGRAYENGGGVVYSGTEGGVSVAEGANNLSIDLSILVGTVSVTGTLTGYTIVIDTTTFSTWDLDGNPSGQAVDTLVAWIIDSAGDTLGVTGGTSDANPVWAIRNPAIASIDSTALSSGDTLVVTGLLADSTFIVATYKGFLATFFIGWIS